MAAPDDAFFASLERNFIGIGCTMEDQTTVSNLTQCGLFISEYQKIYGLWSKLLKSTMLSKECWDFGTL